jgi:hypothetical protein
MDFGTAKDLTGLQHEEDPLAAFEGHEGAGQEGRLRKERGVELATSDGYAAVVEGMNGGPYWLG